MMTQPRLALLGALLFFASCKEYAYYQNVYQGNTSAYKKMPTRNEGRGTANYVSASLFTGGANYGLRDGFYGANGSLYRGHAFSLFRAFYGVDASVGAYRV